MITFSTISLMGAGAWGTTVANHVAKKGVNVRLWDQNEKVALDIMTHRINDEYLPGIELSDKIIPYTSFEEWIKDTDLLILAVPSKYLYASLYRLGKVMKSSPYLLALTKGLFFEEKPLLISDVIHSNLQNLPLSKIAILSGPNFALEIARDMPAASVVAGSNEPYLLALQTLLTSTTFRVYRNTDLIGVQLGGMMKNVIALSAGIIDGLDLGMNLKSALLVRGVIEMSRIFEALGADPKTLYGLSGLGDLIATCMSDLSRNRWAGLQIGKGLTYQELISYGRTVEGIETLPSLLKLATFYNIDLPICQATSDIIFKGKKVREAIADLMTRTLKAE